MHPFTLRLAIETDLPAIHDIYNHYVLHSTATYQTAPDPLSAREGWFHSHGPLHPITVAISPANEILAWASLSPFHVRAAYSQTVEDSVYVHPSHHRQGIGTALLDDLISRARSLRYHTIIALISNDQTPSLMLHQKHGFTSAGLLHQVGYKFDRYLDVAYLQKIL